MTACTSPRLRPSETPFRISRPSTATRRSSISNSANFLPLSGDVVRAAGVAGAQPGGAGDHGSQQPLVDVLLVPAGVSAPGGDVLDRAVAVTELELTVRALTQLRHVSLLGGQAGQLADARVEVEAGQPGAVLGLEPPRPGGEEPVHLLVPHEADQLAGELAVAAGKMVPGGRRQA